MASFRFQLANRYLDTQYINAFGFVWLTISLNTLKHQLNRNKFPIVQLECLALLLLLLNFPTNLIELYYFQAGLRYHLYTTVPLIRTPTLCRTDCSYISMRKWEVMIMSAISSLSTLFTRKYMWKTMDDGMGWCKIRSLGYQRKQSTHINFSLFLSISLNYCNTSINNYTINGFDHVKMWFTRSHCYWNARKQSTHTQ